MASVWLLVLLAMVGVARGADSECMEHPSCQDVNSESSMKVCIQLCQSDLSGQTPKIPSDLRPSSDLSPSSAPQAMEHSRRGKPVERKRRSIKTSNGVEEESAKGSPAEMRRRELGRKTTAEGQRKEPEGQRKEPEDTTKDSEYKIQHFRWNAPPASKRYGGFTRSRDERRQRPLLSLFTNVINKEIQQQDEE